MSLRRQLLFLAVLLGTAAASAVVSSASSPPPPAYLEKKPVMFEDPRKAVQSSPDFNMMQNLAASIKNVERLFDKRLTYTAFVPRNVAFAKIPRSLLNEIWIPGNELWPRVFWHHFSVGLHERNSLQSEQTLTMVDGGTVLVTVRDGTVYADGVPVIGEMRTPGWVMYVVDSLLIPASAKDDFLTRKR